MLPVRVADRDKAKALRVMTQYSGVNDVSLLRQMLSSPKPKSHHEDSALDQRTSDMDYPKELTSLTSLFSFSQKPRDVSHPPTVAHQQHCGFNASRMLGQVNGARPRSLSAVDNRLVNRKRVAELVQASSEAKRMRAVSATVSPNREETCNVTPTPIFCPSPTRNKCPESEMPNKKVIFATSPPLTKADLREVDQNQEMATTFPSAENTAKLDVLLKRHPLQIFERFIVKEVNFDAMAWWKNRQVRGKALIVESLVHDFSADAEDVSVGDKKMCRRRILCLDNWKQTPIRVGHIIHIVDAVWEKVSFTEGLEDIPTCVVDNGWNGKRDVAPCLILEPDLLTTSTTLSSCTTCLRRAWFDSYLRPSFGTVSTAPLLGSIIHGIFQDALKKDLLDERSLLQTATRSVGSHITEMYASAVSDIQASNEIRKVLNGIKQWNETFRYNGDHQRAAVTFGGNASSRQVRVTDVVDIEETISSPAYGLKGKIDATLKVSMRDLEDPSASRVQVIPLELKTGKHTANGAAAHRAQVLMYLALVRDQYQEELPAGLLCYLPYDNNAKASTSGSKLMDDQSHFTYGVSWSQEVAHLLQLRNAFVESLEHADPPPHTQDQRACRFCHHSQSCALWHQLNGAKDLTTNPLLSEARGTYLKHWLELLDIERRQGQSSKDFVKLIVDTLPQDRDVLGTCIHGLSLVSCNASAQSREDRHVCVFTKPLLDSSAVKLPFGDGDRVCLGELRHLMVAMGEVQEVRVDVDRKQLSVSIFTDKNVANLNTVDSSWCLDVASNDFDSFSRARHHLFQLLWDPNLSRKAELLVDLSPPLFRPLGDHNDQTSSIEAMIAAYGGGGTTKALHVMNTVFLDQMNADQRDALSLVLRAEDYALILGMPGTGKTTTAAIIIAVLAALGKKILITAHTHSAVDSILLKCLSYNVKFLRLGRPAQVDPRLHAFIPNLDGSMSTVAELEELMLNTNVLATTSMSVHNPLLSRHQFDYCILDEASQILQPIALGPLMLPRTFVLIGDHKQLPPLIRSREAKAKGMDESVFYRLCNAHPQALVKLTFQYRMNASIMSISNTLVYEGEMKCGALDVENQTLELPSLDCIKSTPIWLRRAVDPSAAVVFLNVDQIEHQGGSQSSAIEAELLKRVSLALLSAGGCADAMGIICPYHAQIGLLQPFATAHGMEIMTIDKSQGREKECILVSLVCRNSHGNVGELLSDLSRLNVAFSRARSKLIVVGSFSTFAPNPLWSKLLNHFQSRDWVVNLSADTLLSSSSPSCHVHPNNSCYSVNTFKNVLDL